MKIALGGMIIAHPRNLEKAPDAATPRTTPAAPLKAQTRTASGRRVGTADG